MMHHKEKLLPHRNSMLYKSFDLHYLPTLPHFPTINHFPMFFPHTHHTCDTPPRLISPLQPHPSGLPKIFFSFSLFSFVKLTKYDASIASNATSMIQLNHTVKVTQNFKSSFRPCNIFFCICNIKAFFSIFSRFISPILPVLSKKTPVYKLPLQLIPLRQEPHFRSQKNSSASQEGTEKVRYLKLLPTKRK